MKTLKSADKGKKLIKGGGEGNGQKVSVRLRQSRPLLLFMGVKDGRKKGKRISEYRENRYGG